MPKKKKKFIDKKKAAHFYVVHRSQQDPLYNDPESSNLVLQPVNAAAHKSLDDKGESYPTSFVPPGGVGVAEGTSGQRILGDAVEYSITSVSTSVNILTSLC